MKKVPFLHRAPFKEHNLNSWKFSMNQSYKNFRSFVEFRGNNQRLFRGGVKRVRDRESASRVCAAATIAVARERQSDKKLSLAVEIMSWNRVRVREVLLGCRVYDLSRRGCVFLSFFLSQPATTRFHHISPSVLSRSPRMEHEFLEVLNDDRPSVRGGQASPLCNDVARLIERRSKGKRLR